MNSALRSRISASFAGSVRAFVLSCAVSAPSVHQLSTVLNGSRSGFMECIVPSRLPSCSATVARCASVRVAQVAASSAEPVTTVCSVSMIGSPVWNVPRA